MEGAMMAPGGLKGANDVKGAPDKKLPGRRRDGRLAPDLCKEAPELSPEPPDARLQDRTESRFAHGKPRLLRAFPTLSKKKMKGRAC
jgi:hypothetical protein